jgi:hypothetical protein
MNHTSGQSHPGCSLMSQRQRLNPHLRERINTPMRQAILREGVSA